jgi:hypothetical protein
MMLRQLMQEKEDAMADEEEKLLIMVALLRLHARINAPPQRVGSRPGKKKNKDGHRMHGGVMLKSDYHLADNAIHTSLEFQRRSG